MKTFLPAKEYSSQTRSVLSQRTHDVIITSILRRNDVATTVLLRHVSAGMPVNARLSAVDDNIGCIHLA